MPKVGVHEVHCPKPSAPESRADGILRVHIAFTPGTLWDGSAVMPLLFPNPM